MTTTAPSPATGSTTSTGGGGPSATPAPTGHTAAVMSTVTTVHLVLLALFAVLVVIAILYGMRLRGRRRSADRAEAAFIDATQDRPNPPLVAEPAPPPSPAPVAAPAPAAPTPVLPDEPVPATADAPAELAASGPAGDAAPVGPAQGPVTQLKGLGPKVATRLAELGITTVGQIAALDAGQADALDTQLGPFAGRLTRDRWVEQARFLAAGDTAGFEAVFGRL